MSQLRDERPILLVPYLWIGDFVRCHSVVKVLKERFPYRPVDIVSSTLCAPLADYMPGVRKAIVHDIPRRKLAYRENAALAEKLKPGHYGTSLIMSRKWKAALPSYLAGIPERVGFVGEMRYGVLVDIARGDKPAAQAVIRQIVDSLDNTLAATALLASAQGLDPRDADVGALIELSLGDLDAARRSRVRIERVSPTRTASMDIGLMRLALRNVLGNALAYSPAGSEVVLRVVDSDEPLALVFEIADRGPGIPAELMPRLFERGARGSHGVPGHGIGLHVVRRVMELHGGSVDVQPNTPQGAVFRLWLPQGQ